MHKKQKKEKNVYRRHYSSAHTSILKNELFMRFLGIIIFGGFFILLAYSLWQKFSSPNVSPIRHVKIVSNDTNYINPQQLARVVQENIRGGFFSLKANLLKDKLMEIPWMENVSIRRVWPDKIVVDLQEHKPLARFGKFAVLSQSGELFYPNPQTIPKNLATLVGPKNLLPEIIKKYKLYNSELQLIGLSIAKLQLSSRLSWQIELNNGIYVMLGREEVRARFARFIMLYPRLVGDKGANVVRIDLRYPNGLAIQWKDYSQS